MKLKSLVIAAVIFFAGSLFAQDNLPKCKEAVLLGVYSPTEVNIKAKGLGKDADRAEKDARKSAVYYMIYNAQDKILQTSAEKEAFQGIEQKFFEAGNIDNFITFMGNDILSRVKTSEGVKIEKLVRVNTAKLKEELQSQGVLVSKDKMAEVAGNPFLMVIPEVGKGENPIDKLQSDKNYKKAAEVIEGFLTTQRYDVQVPEQMEQLNDQIQAQADLKGAEDDISYKIALAIGSDVYITYNVQVESGNLGKKAVVAARAYETTTARLLGTETGYSETRVNVPDAAVIEEAMNDAAGKVLQRINGYWKDDIKSGMQFKVVFKITAKLDEQAMEDLDDAIDKVVKDASIKTKKGASGDNTKDMILWSKKFKDGDELYKFFRNKFKDVDNVKAKKISVNRKLVIVELAGK